MTFFTPGSAELAAHQIEFSVSSDLEQIASIDRSLSPAGVEMEILD